MLAELTQLLASCPPAATREEYRQAVIDENVLGKRSTSNRKLSFQRLSELYALDGEVPLFRVLRQLWGEDPFARPLLALSCALARDPLLRGTAKALQGSKVGDEVTKPQLEAALALESPRFNASILNKVARNASSSWTQAGFTTGRLKKIRALPKVTAANIAYALVLAHLDDVHGAEMLNTFWVRVFGLASVEVQGLLQAASRRGWIEFKSLGSVVELSVRPLLTSVEVI